ncbi:MAG: helix-turn-helix transcriptional regulator [Chloroflexi bacterium]|nr:helix-turn-helix transcriptional regulator [Chloroflexota bacterium]
MPNCTRERPIHLKTFINVENKHQFVLLPCQKQVLALAAEGKTYKEIAHQLSLSEASIQYHMKHIQNLMGVQSKSEAIAIMIRKGLLL